MIHAADFNTGFKASNRLMAYDISKMPVNSFAINEKEDYYTPKKRTNSAYWTKFFTVASFALTGLYLAHRNNLFNPVKREARKILRSEELTNKLKEYISTKLNPDSYNDFTNNLLKKYAGDKTRTEGFVAAAQEIIGDEKRLTKLFDKVSSRLADDGEALRHGNGFVSDMLDLLGMKIEKLVQSCKNNNLPYKNKQGEFMDKLFSANNGSSVADETLFDIFKSRAGSIVENFVKEANISSTINKV